MKADYWEPGDRVFVHAGKRYAITATGRTVCIGGVESANTSNEDKGQLLDRTSGNILDTSKPNVTDNANPKCVICSNPIPGKRIDRHFCSIRCRVKASRRGKQLVMV
jgi:hypothetical protein